MIWSEKGRIRENGVYFCNSFVYPSASFVIKSKQHTFSRWQCFQVQQSSRLCCCRLKQDSLWCCRSWRDSWCFCFWDSADADADADACYVQQGSLDGAVDHGETPNTVVLLKIKTWVERPISAGMWIFFCWPLYFVSYTHILTLHMLIYLTLS